VDDDAQVLDLLALALGEDHAVRTAQTGAEALRLLDEEGYDLVVLDLSMPGMDGVAVKRAMDGRSYQVPVLLLSGEADLRDRAEELAASDYLAKPFCCKELSRRVAGLLSA
jgi:two-component system, OmpR family, response regulator